MGTFQRAEPRRAGTVPFGRSTVRPGQGHHTSACSLETRAVWIPPKTFLLLLRHVQGPPKYQKGKQPRPGGWGFTVLWVGRGNSEGCIHKCVLICTRRVTKLFSQLQASFCTLPCESGLGLCNHISAWELAAPEALPMGDPRADRRLLLPGHFLLLWGAPWWHSSAWQQQSLPWQPPSPFCRVFNASDLASSRSLRDSSTGQPPPVSEGWSSALGGFSSEHPDWMVPASPLFSEP